MLVECFKFSKTTPAPTMIMFSLIEKCRRWGMPIKWDYFRKSLHLGRNFNHHPSIQPAIAALYSEGSFKGDGHPSMSEGKSSLSQGPIFLMLKLQRSGVKLSMTAPLRLLSLSSAIQLLFFPHLLFFFSSPIFCPFCWLPVLMAHTTLCPRRKATTIEWSPNKQRIAHRKAEQQDNRWAAIKSIITIIILVPKARQPPRQRGVTGSYDWLSCCLGEWQPTEESHCQCWAFSKVLVRWNRRDFTLSPTTNSFRYPPLCCCCYSTPINMIIFRGLFDGTRMTMCVR